MAETDPAIMHHFNGRGSIAYGTKMMNSTYQMRYSRSAKPNPSPMKPCRLSNSQVQTAAQCR